MTPRPVVFASILTALAVGWAVTREASQDAAGEGDVARVAAPAEVKAISTQAPTLETRAGQPGAAAFTVNPAKVASLAADAGALLAEQAAVQLLVKDADLPLTAEQWADFAAVTSQYQAVRQTYEATIATAVAGQPQRLEIPAYPAAGDALREKFYSALRERLGPATAEVIALRAGSALEGYFGGFGVGVQTLDFGADAAAVTRTAQYWNSTQARDTLTLRRETHFPQMEDPSGERWGAFLALLPARGEKAGS